MSGARRTCWVIGNTCPQGQAKHHQLRLRKFGSVLVRISVSGSPSPSSTYVRPARNRTAQGSV